MEYIFFEGIKTDYTCNVFGCVLCRLWTNKVHEGCLLQDKNIKLQHARVTSLIYTMVAYSSKHSMTIIMVYVYASG